MSKVQFNTMPNRHRKEVLPIFYRNSTEQKICRTIGISPKFIFNIAKNILKDIPLTDILATYSYSIHILTAPQWKGKMLFKNIDFLPSFAKRLVDEKGKAKNDEKISKISLHDMSGLKRKLVARTKFLKHNSLFSLTLSG